MARQGLAGTATGLILACIAWLPVAEVVAQPVQVPLFKAATLQDVLVAPDGAIIATGSQSFVDATPVERLVALRPDGSIDAAWSHAISGVLYKLLRHPVDGSVLAMGDLTAVNGQPRIGIARFATDGTLLPWQTQLPGLDGNPVVLHADVLPNGDLIALAIDQAGAQRLFRVDDATGAATPSWEVAGGVRELRALADGSVVVAGSVTAIGGVPIIGAARLAGAGLQPANLLQGSPASIAALDRDAVDGSWYVASDNTVQRFLAAGPVDASWSVSADGPIDRVVVDGMRGVLASGGFTRIAGVERARVARLRKDAAAVDGAWVPPVTRGRARVLAVAGDVVVAGGNLVSAAGGQVGLLRVSAATGQAVPVAQRRRFGIGGNGWEPPHRAVGLADGGVVVTGPFTHTSDAVLPGIVRLDASGAVRRDWAPTIGGQVLDMALGGDGNLYLGGTLARGGEFAEGAVIRVDLATGTMDPAWRVRSLSGNDAPFAVDGSFIYVFQTPANPNEYRELVRWSLSVPAAQDPGWRAPARVFANFRNLMPPRADGSFVFGLGFGCCVDFNPPPPPGPPVPLLRLTRAGAAAAVDFGPALVEYSDVARVRTDAQGRIYMSGPISLAGQTDRVFPRLFPDGTLDAGFQFRSANQWPDGAMAVSGDGNFVYATLAMRDAQLMTRYRTVRFDTRSGAIDDDWTASAVDGWRPVDITLAGNRVFVVTDFWERTNGISMLSGAFLATSVAAQFRDGFEAPPPP